MVESMQVENGVKVVPKIISEEVKLCVVRRVKAGESVTAISRECGFSRSAIHAWVRKCAIGEKPLEKAEMSSQEKLQLMKRESELAEEKRAHAGAVYNATKGTEALEDNIRALEAENERITLCVRKLTSSNNDLKSINVTLGEENKRVKVELAKVTQELTKLKSNLENELGTKAQVLKSNVALSSNVSKLKDEIVALIREKEQLQKDSALRCKESTKLREDAARLESLLVGVVAERDMLKKVAIMFSKD